MGRKMLPGARVCWNQIQSGGLMVAWDRSHKGALVGVISSHSLKFRNQETYRVLEKLLSYSQIFGTQGFE